LIKAHQNRYVQIAPESRGTDPMQDIGAAYPMNCDRKLDVNIMTNGRTAGYERRGPWSNGHDASQRLPHRTTAFFPGR
jgi:hypothetical protein